MRVLIDNGCYGLNNVGDIGMLQVAIDRVLSIDSSAQISVFTRDENRLRELFPEVIPVDGKIRQSIVSGSSILRHCRDILPWKMAEIARFADRHCAIGSAVKRKVSERNSEAARSEPEGLQLVSDQDFAICSGGGVINDEFATHAMDSLALLGVANRLGCRTAMFGQGLGPIKNQRIASLARRVFPRIDLICLRENGPSLDLAQSLMANRKSVRITGDDAIQIGRDCRTDALGDCIGFNVRVASYSGFDAQMLTKMKDWLDQLTQRRPTSKILPIPIAVRGENSDYVSLSEVFGLHDEVIAQAKSAPAIAAAVSRCRLVVTGSYHAAVFALSQGIPAVCMYRSPYYHDKFLGLMRQFSDIGCVAIDMTSNSCWASLTVAVDELFENAEIYRGRLHEEASRQINLSRAAYCNFFT